MECKKESNLKYCNCTYSCSRKGTCCDCLHYHRQMGELPACYFPANAERTYDRSIRYFISLYEKEGGRWLRIKCCRYELSMSKFENRNTSSLYTSGQAKSERIRNHWAASQLDDSTCGEAVL